MFENILAEQNKHWSGEKIAGGFTRDITAQLEKYLTARQIIALAGVRRCGKSTVLKQLINFLIQKKSINPKNILFLNLENPVLASYKNDVRSLTYLYNEYLQIAAPKGRVYVFLDEAQFFKDWPIFIKNLYENSNVKFIITGSNSRLLAQDMTTLLSGRAITKTIYPFTFKEILQINKIDTHDKIQIVAQENKILALWKNYTRWGGFPEITLSKDNSIKNEILSNYYRSIVYQDIVPRFEIKKPKETENLLLYLFSTIGRGYSYSSLSRNFMVNDKTAKEYINYFTQAFLIFEISNYRRSFKKQENFNKKPYAIDVGFINAVAFKAGENAAFIQENILFIATLNHGKETYYYRQNHECDFIIKENNKTSQAIQITEEINDFNKKRELAGLKEATERFGLKHGLVLTHNQTGQEKLKGLTVDIKPLWRWIIE